MVFLTHSKKRLFHDRKEHFGCATCKVVSKNFMMTQPITTFNQK